jgi:hypothetical protein
VNIAALFTDKALSSGISPVKTEKRGNRRIQLSLLKPESIVLANLALKFNICHNPFLSRFLIKETHISSKVYMTLI